MYTSPRLFTWLNIVDLTFGMSFILYFVITLQVNAIKIDLTNNRYPVFWNVDETHEPKINITDFNILSKNYLLEVRKFG